MARLVHVLMAGIRTGDVPVASGLAYAYDTGTTTPGTYLYTDNTLLSAAANPVVLDADGRAEVYCADTANFRIRVRNAADTTTIIDVDPAESSAGTSLASITVGSSLANAFTAGAAETSNDAVGFLWDSLSGSATSATAKDLKYLHTGTGAVGRTIRANLSDRFNVMDFGAAGTGSADDAAAIQLAIDAASAAGGGAVFFPCNIYRCDSTLTLNDDDGVSLIGDGPGSIIRQNFTNAALITISGTSDSIEICHLQLQGGGNTGTTAALGVSVATGIPATLRPPVNIHDVVFSGPSDGTGFNVGVECIGTRTSVNNCYFARIYGTNSMAVRFNTGSYTKVTNNHILGADGAGTRMVTGIGGITTVSGSFATISGNYVEGTSGAGIHIYQGTGITITGNRVYACQGAGIRLSSAQLTAVTGNNLDGNQYGVLVDSLTGVIPYGLTISGNSCSSNTVNGVRMQNLVDSASYTPRLSAINGNTIYNSTQSGIVLYGTDNVLVSGNHVSNCATNNTYPAIDVQTSYPVADHRGGNYNTISGNFVTDAAGLTWSYGIRIVDNGGGAITYTGTTMVNGNRFGLTTAPAEYTYGVTTSSPLWWGNMVTDLRGPTVPYRDYTGSANVDALFSGGIITNSGAAGAVTMTLPNLTSVQAENGMNFTFLRVANQNFIIAAGAGDTIIRSNAATGSITLTATTDQVLKVYARGLNWYALITDVT